MKKFFEGFKKIFSKSFKSYPITNICVWLLTILFVVVNNIDGRIDNFYPFFALFSFLGIGTYVVESKILKKIFYIIPTVIAIIYYCIVEFSVSSVFLSRLAVFYIISCLLISIYFNYKNSKKDFLEYLRELYTSLFKILFVYGIVALSILIIGMIFSSLIFDIGYDFIGDLEILWLGIYLGTNTVYMFKASEETLSNFVKFVIRNVLMPIAYIAIIITYLYVIKVFASGEIPSTGTFYAITTLFVITINAVLTSNSYKEEKLIDKINKYSNLYFLPFILIQVLSVGNSIYWEGLGTDMYMATIIIVLEITYIILSVLKKDYGILFIVAICCTFMSTIVPFVNMEDLCDYIQYKNLELYAKKEEYSEVEISRLYHAYAHFRYSEEYNGVNVFAKLGIDEDAGNSIVNLYYGYDDETEEPQYRYYNYRLPNKATVDIAGYSKMYLVSYSEYDVILEELPNEDFIKENKTYTYDIGQYFVDAFKNPAGVEKYFENNSHIFGSEQSKIVITDVRCTVKNDKINYISIDGYLLVP